MRPYKLSTPLFSRMGQATGSLEVSVVQEGEGVDGIPVTVRYEDGTVERGVTEGGVARFAFDNKRFGQATVSIVPHPCCRAVPSDTQTVTLSSTAVQAAFSMVRDGAGILGGNDLLLYGGVAAGALVLLMALS